MRIRQFRAASNVRYFASRMMAKFDLVPFTDESQPVVMYGLYKDEDYELLKKIRGVVVWCGTDAIVVNAKRAEIIRNCKGIKHYAKSKQIYETLKCQGIMSEIMPITSTPLNIKVHPRGNCVYCYVCSDNDKMYTKYKMHILKKLARELPYKFFFTTIKKYKPKDLMKIYERCFIGIRLLDHDGLSNSILEMGLMGRRTISNSSLPGTIPWGSYKGIKTAIIREFNHRKQDNIAISRAVRKYIDIGDKWLEYDLPDIA